MRTLLTRLGQPDAGLKIVHVAGTKGKGSTSAMLSAMLTAAGYRTGVFSSPHLERIEERFAVDGVPCSAGELVALVERMRPVVRLMDEEDAASGDPAGGPTYFEVTTAMALVHFVERQVDAAILEVGLGGRLDATNVCLPVVSVITSISFDHTQAARQHARVDRPREGGDHQAGRAGGERRRRTRAAASDRRDRARAWLAIDSAWRRLFIPLSIFSD